ncbi:hypothetical protein ASG90_14265 [Nocardioides sp. Soil797]|nr:hypothetical protein ASG90_14265 [Nocardioides sp. Soil797]
MPLRPDNPQGSGSDSPQGFGAEHEAPLSPSSDQPAAPYAPPASSVPGSQASGGQASGGRGAQPPGQPSYAGPPSQVPGNQGPGNQGPQPSGPPSQAPGQPSYAPSGSQPGAQTGPQGWQQPSGQPRGAQQGPQQAAAGQRPGGPRPPAYAAQPGMNPESRNRAKLSSGVWPAIAAMSLVIGLVGGGLGGYAVNKWTDDDHSDSQNSSSGLSDDDVNTTPPLPSNSETSDKKPQAGSISAVADVLLPSTVQIIADFNGEEGGATGSGFFLDKQGHVVTNNHVVADAADGGKITVVDHEGKRYPATVVGRSPVYDLAVLDVEGLKGIHPASLGSSKALQVGEQVVAIGSPLGLSSTVTSGIVSALNRPVTTGGDEDSQSFINAVQTDAAINPGNSGGPLVNLSGQVVGVNSAIATTGGSSVGGESGNIGVGFAIPIEQVRVTADQILSDGEARYPVIGATVQSDKDGGGARIEEVVDNSPAADSGLKKGDLVTALDDRPVTDNATLIVAIRSHLPGDKVTLTVDRDGEPKKFEVELDSKVG